MVLSPGPSRLRHAKAGPPSSSYFGRCVFTESAPVMPTT